MKIQNTTQHQEQKTEIITELKDLLAQPSDLKVRPCPDCRIRFGQESSLSAKHCSSRCKYAPRHMSSEPDAYPIEMGIVPLVYAFYTLRLMTPCWSCEGHLDSKMNAWKKPKVWFYSESSFYPKLVSQVIGELEAQHKISHSWCVKILPFSQSMFTTTYSIEPTDDDLSLEVLHKDIIVLGKLLRYEMLSLARDYVKRATRSPSE